jgi:hypothetical protein
MRIHSSKAFLFAFFALIAFSGSATKVWAQIQAPPQPEATEVVEDSTVDERSDLSKFVSRLGELRISRFNTDTFHGSAAIGDVTGYDIWANPPREKLIGYSMSLVRPKMIYTLGLVQSRLDFSEIPNRFGVPPNLPDFSRVESITFVNMNLGADYVLPRSRLDNLLLAVGLTAYGARYMYSNNAKNYMTVGLGGQASYRFGLFYLGMEYRTMLLNPEYFRDYFRWEVGLWFQL